MSASVASVVFLRGVNVGGHKAFRPSVLVGQLAALDVVSVGAAGTFVVRSNATAAQVRAAFRKSLPFDAQLMIAPARDLVALVETEPFSNAASRRADMQYICVLEKKPRNPPPLPIYVPEGRDWQVAVTAVRGAFVAALLRRIGRTFIYPNQVVEKRFGLAATTRGWPTILKVHQLLEKGSLRAMR